MEQDPFITTLTTLAESLDNKKTLSEMMDSFELVIEFAKETRDLTENEVKNIRSTCTDAIKSMKTANTEEIEKIKDRIVSTISNEVEKLTARKFEVDVALGLLQDKVNLIKNGEDADEERVIKAVLEQIPPPEIHEESPTELRDKLEKLEGDERIDKSAVKGLEEAFNDLTRLATTPKGGGGSGGVVVFDSTGNKVGSGSGLRFVGATVTNTDGRMTTVTIAGGGSGVTVVTPTGTVNGSNTVFTVASQPKWVVVDSSVYFETLHYTYSGVTLTMDALIAPTEFIRAIL